jgi:hypothetical protein
VSADGSSVRPHHGSLRHLLLTLSLVVVTLSVLGMHQLSVGHDLATGPVGRHADAEATSHGGSAGVTMPLALDASAGQPSIDGRGAGAACPDCGDHQMTVESCLLALTLLVLSWMLGAPRLRHLPPFLLPRLTPTMVGPSVGRLVPPLSLTELSLRRT